MTLQCDKNYLNKTPIVAEKDYLSLLGIFANFYTSDNAMLRWTDFIKSLNPQFSHIAQRDNPIANTLSRTMFEGKEKTILANHKAGLKFFILSNLHEKIGSQVHVFDIFPDDMYEGKCLMIGFYLRTLTK